MKPMMKLIPVNETSLAATASVHAISWRAAHAELCSVEFLAAHTAERQQEYLWSKLQSGSRIFLLTEDIPVGLVTVTGNRIEDLYVLPERQSRGCGTALLQHAIRECSGMPTLWVLETNRRAIRFYERRGFQPTGRMNRENGPLAELEYVLSEEKRKIQETWNIRTYRP